MPFWHDGLIETLNLCGGAGEGRGTGLTHCTSTPGLFAHWRPLCSGTAEQWEPDEVRASHPVLRARGVAIPRASQGVVLCKSCEEADAALPEIRAWVAENGCGRIPRRRMRAAAATGAAFEFLGYRFEAGDRAVRRKSLTRFKEPIRKKTNPMRGYSLARIIADLNRALRGWFGYFKHANPRTFILLDQFIRSRASRFRQSLV